MSGVHSLLVSVGAGPDGAREVLAARGHDLATARSEAEAVEALARGPTPDLVVVTAGDAAAAAGAIAAVRSHVRGEAVPIVALVPEAAVEATLDAGALLALPGPGTPAVLGAAVAAAERAAVRLRAAEPRVEAGHEALFAKNPHPMWFFDVDTLRFVAVNDAAVQKYGWSREELLAMTIKDIRPREDVGRLLRATGHVASGLDRTAGWQHRAKDGRIFHVEIISYPVRFGGRPCELVLAHDVSDRVEAERKLEVLRAQLAVADRMASVGTLAAGVAHEINNPLTFLLANLAFAGERLRAAGPESAEAGRVREALDDAVDGARRVQEIVRDLRAFSRADDASCGPVGLSRVVEGALALAANELRHRARAVVDVAGAPPVLANEARVGQVLLNLVVNAAHAIPEGDVAGNEVRIGARAEGDRVVVEVSDTGTGVPPEIRARIFEPFFTTKPVGEGTGLGLWVCRRIVAALGGTIELAPSRARGATFRLVLPRAPAGDAAPAPHPPPRAPAPARRPRLLVVDDEPLVGRALQRALRGDADVEVEVSGAGALARIRRGERFDVVLSDVMMPELPGADFHAELQRFAPEVARSVVFMTGGAFSLREREFLAGIPNACLDKPLDLEQLRALLLGRG